MDHMCRIDAKNSVVRSLIIIFSSMPGTTYTSERTYASELVHTMLCSVESALTWSY